MSVALIAIVLGAHWHMDVLVTLGTATLIPAALLALQSKRTPPSDPNEAPSTPPVNPPSNKEAAAPAPKV